MIAYFFIALALLCSSTVVAADYAQLDQNNVVIRVVIIGDENEKDVTGVSRESVGIAWCQYLFGGGTWIKTAEDGSLRMRFAGIGYTYDAGLDAFLQPKPFPSWVLNPIVAAWVAPIAYPTDGDVYHWDEPSGAWVSRITP